MMVISVCVNDTVLLLYTVCYYLKAALVHHVTFSSSPAFGGYWCITKLQNRFQYFNRLVY